MSADQNTDVSQERKWAGRPVLAFFVRSAVYVVPIAASVLASVWLSKVIPAPESVWHVIGWWVAIIAGSTSVLFLVDKGVRRLLPLAALLQMTMIFPDKSPSRFRTALRSGASIKHLTAQLRAAEEAGLDDDPTRAAEIVLQLSSALNAHDPRTRGHSERVRAYSEMLAEEMGVSEEDRAKLRWASLLHDIGKLKVSPDILNKPGKLDDDEWVEIKNHPTYGAEICGPLIDWLGPWSSAIVEHHERFDGFGYPAGFAGLEIALGGRVVAVADAYDVMTTARSYKKPMPAGAAREELARHAGAQFDPDVVRAFLSLSMGRLRWVAGPLSWLAQLPFLRFAGGIQSVGTTVGVAAAATTGAAAALAGGLVSVPGVDALPLPPPPLALVEYVDTPVTTLPAVSTPVVVAGADVRPATEDAPATFGVLGNDVFLPGSALGILIPPGHGEATVNDDLTITYVPDDDFAGVDTFTYQITGPNGDTASATVTVEVGEVNDLPEANDDAATVDEDDSVIVDVLANDTDTEGLDPSSVTVGSGPVSGTVTIDPVTGVVTYTPDTDFAGSDAFIYTVADTDGVLVTATVTITVTPINDPPVAVNDSASTDEEVTALIAVLGNDSDIEGGLVPGSVTMSVSPSNGTTTVSGGAVSYTPDPDFNGVDSFGYQVCDDAAACDTATVTVNPINDPPIVPGPGPLATDEDVPISFDPLAAASDVDGDALTVSTFDATTTAGGTVVLGSLEYHPPADWSGDDSFTYTVTDGTDSVVIAVTITVNPVNDPPAGTPPALAGTEDTPIILDPLVGFTDAEGDPISLDSLDAVSAAGGTLTYAAGLITYTPADDHNGTDTFTYILTDGTDTTTIPVTITLTPTNDTPVLDPIGPSAIDEGVLLSFVVTASDVELPGDALTFSLSGEPTGAAINATTGVFTWTPTEVQGPGAYLLDVVVTDDGSPVLSDTETITVTVNDVNTVPVLDPVGNQVVDEGVLLGFTATATDADLPANSLTFSLSGAPPGASINPTTGAFTWTPTEAQGAGAYLFDVVVTDDGSPNLAASELILVTVDEVNIAPVLDPVGNRVVDETVLLSFTATATDADLLANTLTFSLSGAPAGAAINPSSGAFTWTPTEAQGAGAYVFDVVVTDDGTPNLADSETITVTVNEINLAPVLDPVGNQVVNEGALLSFTATASDADLVANTLTFSLSFTPAGASINPTTGVFTWTPTEALGPTAWAFDVVVTDDGSPNLSDSETIVIIVNEVNIAPVLDPVGNQVVDEGVLLSFSATASDADLPSNALGFSLSGAPVGAAINPTTGAFTWTPTEAQGPGVYVFNVVVADDGTPNLADSETITVTVDEANIAPVLDPVGNRVVDEGVLLSFVATASDADVPANGLTFSLSGAVPTGAGITPGGLFTWLPSEAQGPGSYAFDVVVTDDGSPVLNDSESITVTVNEVNAAPVIDFIADQVVDEGVLLSFTATAIDPGDIPANALTFSLSGAPAGAAIDPTSGAFTWTPTEAQGPGSYGFDVVVTDDGTPNLNDSESITVTVNEANIAPVLDPVGDRVVDEGVLLGYTATASDGDVPADGLTFSLSGAPAGAAINPTTGAFTWTPTETQGAGAYVFDVVVTDDGVPNLADSETITVTVDEVNVAPVLGAIGPQSGDELTSISFVAAASDPDLPANNLTYSLSGTVPAGASINPLSGVLDWTPSEGQDGIHTFDVVVTDDGSPNLGDSETITVTVNEVNVAPVLGAVGDRSVDETALLAFTATATDADLAANTLTVSLSGAPAGAAINPSTGAFTWTPSEALGGSSATFDVVVTDDGTPSLNDSETITVTVNEVNVAPVLDPIGAKSVNEAALLSFAATASDSDLPADGLTFSLSGEPVGAAITSAGAFSWTPTEAQGPGAYVFDVVVTDDGSPSLNDSESITVTVNEVNAAPVLDPIGAQSGNEGSLLTFAATASDPADIPANALTFSLSGEPAGAAITSAGVFTWTPTEAQGPGAYVFDVVVTDDGTPDLADSESITFTVNEANNAPLLDPVGDKVVDEGVLLGFTATASDSDLPADGLTFSLSGEPAGAAITSAGAFTWTPTEAQGAGVYVFDVIVTDDGAPNLNDSETIAVTVDEVNVAPVLGAVGDKTVDELTLLSFTATATDADLPANTLTFSLSGAPAGAAINPSTGAFTWTPSEAQGPGSYVFDVIVTDDGAPNLNDSETIAVTVDEVNVAPVLGAVGDKTVDELTLLSFTATATDADLPANTLTFSLSGEPAGAAITSAGAFTWTPTEAQGAGVYVFDVIVTDDGAPNLNDSETIAVTVDEVNVAPVLGAVGDKTVDELTLLSFTATATDADLPANTLTFSLSGEPLGASINPATGAFTWTPTEAQGGWPYVFDVVVTDDGAPNLADSETITVTVNDTNVAPVLDPIGAKAMNEAVLLSFSATASDSDLPADGLTFSLSGGPPAGAGITPGGLFTWTPTEAQGPGSYGFNVVVTDDGSPVLNDFEAITVTVNEVNSAPVLGAVGNKIVNEGVLLSFTATATDPSDTPANGLTFSLSGTVPAGASINPTTGAFTWTPTEAQGPGSYGFSVVVTDDGTPNLNDSEAITVTVNEVNVAPAVTNPGHQVNIVGSSVSLPIGATDADLPANTLTYGDAGTLPPGLSINASSGVISGTPSAAGSYAVTITVTDDGTPNLNGSAAFTWDVAAPPVGVNIVISEWRTTGPAATSDEFIELYNPTASPIVIDGWQVWPYNSGGNRQTGQIFTIDDGLAAPTTLGPGEHYLMVQANFSGPEVPDQAPYGASLPTAGGLMIVDAGLTPVDAVGSAHGGTPLPDMAGNTDQSYERFNLQGNGNCIDTDVDVNDFFHNLVSSNPQNRADATVACGAPAAPPALPSAGDIVISEVRTRGPAGTDDEFIELFNPTAAAIPLAGWELRNGAASILYTFGAVSLNPGQHILIAGTTYPGPGDGSLLAPIGQADAVILRDGAAVVRDTVGFGSALPSETQPLPEFGLDFVQHSYERIGGNCIDTDDNGFDFTHNLSFITPMTLLDAPAPCPLPSPQVVISEMRTVGPLGSQDEFIELYNPTAAPVNIEGWEIRVDDGNLLQVAIIGIDHSNDGPATDALIAPGGFYLLTGAVYGGSTPGDQAFATDIGKGAGIGLYDGPGPAAAQIDAVGTSTVWKDGAGSLFVEGTPLAPMAGVADQSYSRLNGDGAGACVDTDDNASDFVHMLAASTPRNTLSAPQACGPPAPDPAPPSATHVVVSELRTDGPAGAGDEFFELFNSTALAVSLDGHTLWTNESGGAMNLLFTFNSAAVLPPGGHLLLAAASYTGATAPDALYGIGAPTPYGLAGNVELRNEDGVVLINGLLSSDVVVDAVALHPTAPVIEGTSLPGLSGRVYQSYERKHGNCTDRDDNAIDFFHNVATESPRNLGMPPTVCPQPPTTLHLKATGAGSDSLLLPITSPPFAPTFPGPAVPDYHDNTDGTAGMKIQKSTSVPSEDETSDSKFQTWSFPVTDPGGLPIANVLELRIYSATQDFDTGKTGHVVARLSHCPPGAPRHSNGCLQLGSIASVDSSPTPWSASGNWELKAFNFGAVGPVVIPMGDELRLKIVVGDLSEDDPMFAFDVGGRASRIELL